MEELPIDKSGVVMLAKVPSVRLPAPMVTADEVVRAPFTVKVPEETVTELPLKFVAVVEPVTLKAALVPPSREPTFPPVNVFATVVELPDVTKSNFVVTVGDT